MQEYFSEIKDPLHEGYIKHKLADVLTIIAVGGKSICSTSKDGKIITECTVSVKLAKK